MGVCGRERCGICRYGGLVSVVYCYCLALRDKGTAEENRYFSFDEKFYHRTHANGFFGGNQEGVEICSKIDGIVGNRLLPRDKVGFMSLSLF